nr:hypothetical protein [Holdemania filiformis]
MAWEKWKRSKAKVTWPHAPQFSLTVFNPRSTVAENENLLDLRKIVALGKRVKGESPDIFALSSSAIMLAHKAVSLRRRAIFERNRLHAFKDDGALDHQFSRRIRLI